MPIKYLNRSNIPIVLAGTDKAIFGYGYTTGVVSMTNLVSNAGVVATDTTGVGTSRSDLAAAGYGGNKAIFGYGYNGPVISMTNLVSNTGVVSTDTTGVGTSRYGASAAAYGTNKAIFGYGNNGSANVSMTNLVSDTGVVATDTTGVGTARRLNAAAGYGTDKAIFGYGYNGSFLSMTNLVSNTGVVATDTTGVGTARYAPAAAGYGSDKAIFGYGNTSSGLTAITNLVSNTGVVANNTAGVGTARQYPSAAGYGSDKAIFGYGLTSVNVSMTNLVSNTGVVATDTTGVGTARTGLAAAGYSSGTSPAPGGIAYKNRNSAGTPTPTGNSVQFNGSNQYLSIPYNSNLWLDSSNWTIECWVYLNSLSTYNVIWDHGYGAPNTIRSIIVYMETTTGLLRIAQTSDGSTNYDTSLGVTLTTNSWKHVAIVRNGANVTAYLNGTAGTSVTAYNLYNSTTRSHNIGIQGDLQSITAYNGYISNHRVVKGTAVYTSNFTPPTAPLTAIANTSLLTCNAATIVDGSSNISNATGAFPIYNTTSDGSSNTGGTRTDTNSSSLVLAIPMNGANNGTTFTDESANIKGSGTAKTITNNGSIPTLTAISKFYGSSAYFSNASAQYIVFGNYGTDFQFTGDFTIECWVYPTTSGATDGSLFVLQSGGSNYFAFNFDPGTQFNIYNNSGGPSWSPSVSSVITGQWNHFALIRSGNTQQIFVNGISIGTNTASGTLGYSSTSADFARIGGGASGAINSYIQDLRVYKGVAKYTANFTPPVNANIITNNNSATVSSTTPFTVAPATSTMKMKKVFADPLTYMIATGGDLITTSGSYKIHQFTTVGTSSFVVSSAGSNPNIECLVVAGGGGGGAGTSNTGAGSGGGGGGVIYSSSISLSQTGTYVVVVGNGGIGGSSSGNNGSNGAGSSITGGSVGVALSATGGGYGATNGTNGGSGGSGGGGAPGGASTTTGGTSTSGQGNSGGNGVSGTYYGASGGGATSVGSNSLGGGVGSTPPNGGLGYTSLITGTSVAYSAGGAGGYNGSIGSVINGSNNTGNGGNGGSQQAGTASAGGSGGSGVVVIKYRYTA